MTFRVKYTRGDTWQCITVALSELDRFKKLMNQLGAKIKVKP